MVKLGKSEVTGFAATSNYEPSLVEEAIAGKLKDAGIRTHGKKKKRYTYTGVSLPEISLNKIDLYYKVQKKKHKSKIYFIVSKGYDNYVSTATDAAMAANVINFIGKIDGVVAHNEEIKRKEQEMKVMDEQVEKQKEDITKAEEEKKQKEKEREDMKNKK